MYGINKNFDFSFLHNLELISVHFANREVILHFGVDVSINIISSISYTNAEGVCTLYEEDLKPSAENLLSLLWQKVELAEPISDKILSLTFSNNVIINIYDDSEIYESFVIQKGKKTLAVV